MNTAKRYEIQHRLIDRWVSMWPRQFGTRAAAADELQTYLDIAAGAYRAGHLRNPVRKSRYRIRVV